MRFLDEHLKTLGYSRVTEINISGLHVDVYTEISTGLSDANTQITVQSIVDSFNPIPLTKKDKRKELNVEGLLRIQLIFPAISDFDELDLVREQFLSLAPAARSPTAKFQKLIDTVQARNQARKAINALTTVTDINNYDVVNTPTWPV